MAKLTLNRLGMEPRADSLLSAGSDIQDPEALETMLLGEIQPSLNDKLAIAVLDVRIQEQ